jgi:hypothetical protein
MMRCGLMGLTRAHNYSERPLPMAHAVYFARFARCGPPALVLCSGLIDKEHPPIGDVAVIMPGKDAPSVHHCLYAQEKFPFGSLHQTKDVDRAERMLDLARLQAEVELAEMLSSESTMTQVEFELYDPVELAGWCMLGHFAALQAMVGKFESPELANELTKFNHLSSVKTRAPGEGS